MNGAHLEGLYGDVAGVGVELLLRVLLIVTLAYRRATNLVSISERCRTPHAPLPSAPIPVEPAQVGEERRRGGILWNPTEDSHG